MLGIEKKFNFMDEMKVPKDLIDTSHEHSDAEPLFATMTAAKAKKMRHHVFTILKRIQQIKMLEQKQTSGFSTAISFNMYNMQPQLGAT